MSVADRKKKNREELKSLIVNSACRIINTEGIDNLTMRKIATMIDYTPTTIYKHFKNKAELLSSIVSETTIEISNNMKALQDSKLRPDEYFLYGFEIYIKMMIGKSEHFKATIMNDMNSEQKFEIFSKDILRNPAVFNISSCISQGIQEGIFEDGNIEELTRYVWISIYGLISRLILEPGMSDESHTEIIKHYLRFLLKSLKK